MTNSDTFNTKENILLCIDQSIKKARETEKKKYPFAVLISPENGRKLNLDNFTCMSKKGFKSIPIIRVKNDNTFKFTLAYCEEELISILRKDL